MQKTSLDCPNIILIGFMGSGKSSIGRILAKLLRFDFIDLDEYILETTGAPSINSLFSLLGEEEFRKIELNSFTKVKDQKNKVIATGGGTLVWKDNLEIDFNNGKIVYLDADFELCKSRAARNDKRPLFKDIEKAKLLFEERKTRYEKLADLVVKCDGKSAQRMAEKIYNSLNLD